MAMEDMAPENMVTAQATDTAIIIILIAAATIITMVMDIPTILMVKAVIIPVQGVVTNIGDEKIGQGGEIIF